MVDTTSALFKRVSAKMAALIPPFTSVHQARTGKLDSTGAIVLNPCEGLPDGWIWVRESFDASVSFSRAAVAALNGVREDLADVPVDVGYNPGGRLCAFQRTLSEETVNQYGKFAAAMGTPVAPAELFNKPVPNALLLDGLVTKSLTTPGLNIAIQPFNTDGLIFPLVDPFDVTASVPGTSGEVRWTIVSIAPVFDPTNPSASVVLTDGTPSTDPIFLFEGDTEAAAAITIPTGNIRLAALMLVNGQVAVDDSTVIVSLRANNAVTYPLNNYAGTTAPVVTDDASFGYSIDSLWFDNTGLAVYWCSDATIAAAVWNAIGGSGSSLSVTDGVTTVTDVDAINFVGATVSDLGGGVAEVDITGGGGGGSASVLLDYQETTDLLSAFSVTLDTWTQILANQNFTVTNGSAPIQFMAAIGMSGTASLSRIQLRFVVDSAGTPVYYKFPVAWASNFAGGSATFVISSLTAGAHTVRLEIWSADSNATIYLRAASQPDDEYLSLQVLQLG